MKKLPLFIVSLFCLLSCSNEMKREVIESLLQEWEGKEIIFPQDICFRVGDRDTFVSINSKNLFKFIYN